MLQNSYRNNGRIAGNLAALSTILLEPKHVVGPIFISRYFANVTVLLSSIS